MHSNSEQLLFWFCASSFSHIYSLNTGVIINIHGLMQDEKGSYADSPRNPVIQVLPKLRRSFPDLILACDVSKQLLLKYDGTL
jgi:delta-aminolevulinic acid dehydratase/porphobilinogen synthase